MAKNTFDAEIPALVLCEAAESFEEEVNLTYKEQVAKTVKTFVDLCALLFLLTACVKSSTSISFPRRVPRKALQTHRYRIDRLSVLQNHSKFQLFLQQISQLQTLEAAACSTPAKLKTLMFS